MPMLDINKQRMQYSLQGQRFTIYDRDDDGNIIYISYTDSDGNKIYYLDDNGNKIPQNIEEKTGFSEPVTFSANISNKLSEVLVKEFGIDDSSSYCQIVTNKGYLPIKSGDYIWKKSNFRPDQPNTNPHHQKHVFDSEKCLVLRLARFLDFSLYIHFQIQP